MDGIFGPFIDEVTDNVLAFLWWNDYVVSEDKRIN